MKLLKRQSKPVAKSYGSCRCVCPLCKSGQHCYNRATNCGKVN